ncbi:hypothetical protein HDV05_001022 [Chytridiales sp. JEL 0842]|nr:hypothetical protein HDV05_001022 [Chytridiales sp. JEL 0842]
MSLIPTNPEEQPIANTAEYRESLSKLDTQASTERVPLHEQQQPKTFQTLQQTLFSASKSLQTTLASIPISAVIAHRSLFKQKPLVTVHAQTPLHTAMDVMADHGLFAVPVYKFVKEDEVGERDFVGIVSMFDVLGDTVFQKVFDEMEGPTTKESSTEYFKRWVHVGQSVIEYFKRPVSELIPTPSEEIVNWCLTSLDSVADLMTALVYSPYHRILVQQVSEDESGDDAPKGMVMVSQTDLLRFILDKRDTLCPQPITAILSTPLSQLHNILTLRHQASDPNQLLNPASIISGATKKLIAVPSDFSAIAAFRVLYLHRVSAVPITHPSTSEIIGTLSASDLRGLKATKESLETLLLPVMEFKESKRPLFLPVGWERMDSDLLGGPRRLRYVKEETGVGDAARMALDSKIHRVWIVESGKPVGVMALSDCLSLLAGIGLEMEDVPIMA